MIKAAVVPESSRRCARFVVLSQKNLVPPRIHLYVVTPDATQQAARARQHVGIVQIVTLMFTGNPGSHQAIRILDSLDRE